MYHKSNIFVHIGVGMHYKLYVSNLAKTYDSYTIYAETQAD